MARYIRIYLLACCIIPSSAWVPTLSRATRASVHQAIAQNTCLPAAMCAAEGESKSGETRITVKIKKPGSSASATASKSAPAESTSAVADDDTKVSIRVKPKEPSAPAPPAAPEAPPPPPEEAMLLRGTQAANLTLILDALKMGANPNVRDSNGRTPLHFMAGVGLAPACVLLIQFGADIEAIDGQGLTPVHMAAGYANAQTLKVLIAAGADLTFETPQGRPLDVVKRLGEYQYKEVWLKRKDKWNKLKKKDDKLEDLKECALALSEPELVKAEFDWDAAVRDVATLIAL